MSGWCDCDGNGRLDNGEKGFNCEDLNNTKTSCSNYCNQTLPASALSLPASPSCQPCKFTLHNIFECQGETEIIIGSEQRPELQVLSKEVQSVRFSRKGCKLSLYQDIQYRGLEMQKVSPADDYCLDSLTFEMAANVSSIKSIDEPCPA